MKKRYFVAAAATLTACIMLFAGCSLFDFSAGATDTRFPYDVAEERGETGSKESWLASLETPATELRRLFEEAKADGSFTGTYFEFLQDLGVEEDDGAYAQQAMRSVVYVRARFSPSQRGASDYYNLGSGIIYALDTAKGDATIITNFHVLFSSDSTGKETLAHISDNIEVFLYGSEIASEAIEASYIGGTMQYDIAVMKVEDCDLLKDTAEHKTIAKEVVACNSDSVTAGERVYAIGNSDGEGLAVAAGVVSKESETATFQSADKSGYIKLDEIRFDAPVNHGNSGGGLFNLSGEFIGMVNGGRESSEVAGFGYAIHANTVLSIAQNIIDTCAASSLSHGAALARLSITVQVTDSRAVWNEEYGKLYIEEKVVVSDVTAGGAADKMGMLAGDTLISAKLFSTRAGQSYTAENTFTREFKLTAFLFEIRRGDRVEFTVSRNGTTKTLAFTFDQNDYFILPD